MLILCDQAQAVGGKLYVLGGAWDSMRRTDGPTFITAAGWLDVTADDPPRFEFAVDFVVEGTDQPFEVSGEVIRQVAPIDLGAADLVAGERKRHVFSLGFIGVPFPEGSFRCRLTAAGAELATSRFRVTAA